MSLDILKREWSNVRTLFFDLYDQLEVDHQMALGKLAWIHDNRSARENPVQLDYLLDFPEATSWLDEVEIFHTLDQLDWTVPLEGHHVVAPFNRVNLGRPNTLVRLEQIAARQPLALNRRELRLCMEVFRANPLSVTGQNFFSSVHPRPGGGGTFSNILKPTFGAALREPALQVLHRLMNDVVTRFGSISILQSEVIDDAKMRGNLLVIVHNEEHQTLFRELLTSEVLPATTLPSGQQVGERRNTLRGTFELWRDPRPPAGQEDHLEVVMKTGPSGPKPTILVLDTDAEPTVLEENRVSNGFYGVGFQKIFAVKPFIPNTALQVQPQLSA